MVSSERSTPFYFQIKKKENQVKKKKVSSKLQKKKKKNQIRVKKRSHSMVMNVGFEMVFDGNQESTFPVETIWARD